MVVMGSKNNATQYNCPIRREYQADRKTQECLLKMLHVGKPYCTVYQCKTYVLHLWKETNNNPFPVIVRLPTSATRANHRYSPYSTATHHGDWEKEGVIRGTSPYKVHCNLT